MVQSAELAHVNVTVLHLPLATHVRPACCAQQSCVASHVAAPHEVPPGTGCTPPSSVTTVPPSDEVPMPVPLPPPVLPPVPPEEPPPFAPPPFALPLPFAPPPPSIVEFVPRSGMEATLPPQATPTPAANTSPTTTFN
jgi:hypothetical protein